MSEISRKELIASRLRKASVFSMNLLKEIDELKERLNLVEIHNDELQEIINRISASAAAITSTVDKSLEELKENDFIMDEDSNDEINVAEELSHGSDEEMDYEA